MDSRLPLLALSARVVVGLCALAAVAVLLASPALPSGMRPVAYSSAGVGQGGTVAQLVPPGDTPDASAAGRDMTVVWEQSLLTGGTPATGYVLRRYDLDTNVSHTILSSCDGIVAALTCTELAVPAGKWRYTVTPVFGSWTGTASLKSATQVTSAATLTFASTTVATLPTTLTGTVSGFEDGEGITFHLDSEAGPLLVGTPATLPTGAADITVTIPAGTDDSAHSVFAVGDHGTLASHSINVLDPPTLVSQQLFDTNVNGKIDRVSVTFSKPLAAYTAGTSPWTLVAVPSGGTLASVTVSGATATLTLAEGGGAANTAAGSFTVALADNAAGIRDAANQTASFAATTPVDLAPPVAALMQVFDANANGKVDAVTVLFSETLLTYTAANVPWTLTAVPSAGSLSSVAVSGATATLTLAEGAGPADTAVGAFRIALGTNAAGIRDAVGNLSSFAATAPVDKATPVRLSMVMNDVNGNGKVDQVAMTFSEPLATYTAGTTGWTLISAPSTDTLASVTTWGATATLTLNEGAGTATTAVGSFTITLATNVGGIRDAAGNVVSWAATAPADGAKPVLVSLSMNDVNLNGKVDQIVAVFTEPLGAYSAGTAPWTLTGVPSGGSLASVAVATTTATLTITEGPGAADTTAGTFTLAAAAVAGGVQDPVGNLVSFAATTPLDKSKPARLSMVMNDVNGNGKVDQVALTFSEALSTYTAGNTGWALSAVPSAATLASVSVSGTTATLTLNEGVGAATTAVGSFTITLATNVGGIRDAAANLTSWAATAPADGARPQLLALNMNDAILVNGKVDQVTAVFTETLGTYTAGTAPWTLTGVPSGGTLASVAVATTTATLTITEGAGAADTTVGSFTLAMASNAAGVKDAAGNLASFATTVPLDKSKPARLTMVMNDVNGNGKVDQVAMTFSEPLASYTAGIAGWTLTSPPSTATLASVTASGTTATLNLAEGVAAATTALGSFKVTLVANAAGIRDAAGNLTAFASTAPTDGAKPVLLTLTMTDTTLNGKVDHATAVFSETLSAYTAANTPWTLTGIPSSGTLASVTVSTATATLTITEGAGAADTTVGSFTVALATNAIGIRDAAGNLASFAATAPADKAAPARLTMLMNDVNGNGRVDQLAMTFSEPLDTYTAGSTPWTFAVAPSGATFGSLTTSGATATLTLGEGAGAPTTAVGTFTVALAVNAAGIRDVAANNTSWTAVAPTDKAAPVLVALTMTDTNFNGKVDHVTAVFSETLSAYTAASTPWTLTGIPSAGTLASVAVATTTATLTITEGAGAADTSVGAMTIALASNAIGIRDAAANLASFAALAPLDGAGPVAISTSSTGGLLIGAIQPLDTLTMVFSEALAPASVPTVVTVTEADPVGVGNDTLSIPGITLGARSLGADTYITPDGGIVDFASSTVTLTNNNTTVSVVVGAACSNAGCLGIGQALVAAAFSFAPAASLTDAAGRPAAGTRADVLRIF